MKQLFLILAVILLAGCIGGDAIDQKFEECKGFEPTYEHACWVTKAEKIAVEFGRDEGLKACERIDERLSGGNLMEVAEGSMYYSLCLEKVNEAAPAQ